MSSISRLKFLVLLLPIVSVTAAFCQVKLMREEPVPDLPPEPVVLASERRIDEKHRLVCELLNGRRTFFETAAIFRRLDDEYPRQLPCPNTPGDSDEERVCWQVIFYVQAVLQMQRCSEEKTKEICARLEREVSADKQRHGTVCLPNAATQ